MSFARVKALGWAFLEVLTETQMNQLDINVSKAIDGVGGGPYVLGAGVTLSIANNPGSARIQWTDAGCSLIGYFSVNGGGMPSTGVLAMNVAGENQITNAGRLRWLSGTHVDMDAGAIVNIAADINCARIISTAINNLFNGAEIDNLTVGAGGTVIIGGTVAVTSAASATWGGTYGFTGLIAFAGAGHARKRVTVHATDTNGQAYGVDTCDRVALDIAFTADRDIQVKDAGAGNGDSIEFSAWNMTGGHTVTLKDTGGGFLFALNNTLYRSVKLVRDAGAWTVFEPVKA